VICRGEDGCLLESINTSYPYNLWSCYSRGHRMSRNPGARTQLVLKPRPCCIWLAIIWDGFEGDQGNCS
jgi:hypothetical protein